MEQTPPHTIERSSTASKLFLKHYFTCNYLLFLEVIVWKSLWVTFSHIGHYFLSRGDESWSRCAPGLSFACSPPRNFECGFLAFRQCAIFRPLIFSVIHHFSVDPSVLHLEWRRRERMHSLTALLHRDRFRHPSTSPHPLFLAWKLLRHWHYCRLCRCSFWSESGIIRCWTLLPPHNFFLIATAFTLNLCMYFPCVVLCFKKTSSLQIPFSVWHWTLAFSSLFFCTFFPLSPFCEFLGRQSEQFRPIAFMFGLPSFFGRMFWLSALTP